MAPEELAKNPWLIAAGWLFLMTLAASLASWGWAIVRLSRRQPLLAEVDEPRVVPWGAGSVAAVVILYLVVNSSAGLVYGAIRPRPEGAEIPAADQLALMVSINLLVAALVFPLLRWTSDARAADFGLFEPRAFGRDLARGLVTCLMLSPLVYGVFLTAQRLWKPSAHPVQEALTQDATGTNALLVLVSAVVVAPLAEELLFRGVLLGWLTRAASRATRTVWPESSIEDVPAMATAIEPEPADPSVWAAPRTSREPEERPRVVLGVEAWLANVAVSLFFAGLHSDQWPAPVPLFVLSLGLGWLYQRTGRLAGPVAMHATFNGFSTIMLLLVSSSGVKLPVESPAPVPRPAKAEARVGPEGGATTLVGNGPMLGKLTGRIGDLGSSRRTSRRDVSLGEASEPLTGPEWRGQGAGGPVVGGRLPCRMTRSGADHG